MLFAVAVAMVLVPLSYDAIAVHAIRVVIAAITGVVVLRSFRWSTIDIYPDAVVVRGSLGTSRLSCHEIDRFLVIPETNALGERVEVLGVRVREVEARIENVAAAYPNLAEVVAGYIAKHGYSADDAFVFGLDVILDGLERFR